MPVVLCINKVDRPDARIAEVVDEVYELFMDLLVDAEHHQDQLEFPIVYASAKAGRASLTRPDDGGMPDGDDLEPLFRTIIETIPAPSYDAEAPLQAHVTNLDASNFLGRLALLRVHNGTIRKGQQVAWCRRDGSVEKVKITELLMTDALERRPAEQAGPGDIIAVAGIPEITIGETLADADDPRPLPLITVDEPAISMTIGINTSPMAGRVKGAKVTARLVKDRLDRELVGNVSMRVLPTERPDAWEVQGRGELALAILVEQMRREGYELTVGKPVGRHPRGRRQGPRAGRAPHHRHAGGVPRRDHPAPRRPQGPHGADDQPRHRLGPDGVPRARRAASSASAPSSSPTPAAPASRTTSSRATSRGSATSRPGSAARSSPTARASPPPTRWSTSRSAARCSSSPTTEVYEGMIVGENSRVDDMDVNITKEKKLTNVRSAGADVLERLAPAAHALASSSPSSSAARTSASR